MDVTRLALDTGQLINRAVQFTGETLGQADRTELDPVLEDLLARADTTKTWTDRMTSQTEVLLQPNPGVRFEDRLYGHLDWAVPPRPCELESLGDQMIQAGLDLGSDSPYGASLLSCGQTQKLLGEAKKKFVQSTNIHFLSPLKRFTEVEYRTIQEENRMLLNRRLDLDAAISRLKNTHQAEREARNLNSSPLDDDLLSHVSFMFGFLRVKWLKMWAQEISQAELELAMCRRLFDHQSETTRRSAEGIAVTHMNHTRILRDFVEVQTCYYDQSHQHAQDLQRRLARIPGVLCSNNWQSPGTAHLHQPATRTRPDKQPNGSQSVNPDIRLLNQEPEPAMDPSLALRSYDETNYYNNNNNNNNNNNAAGETTRPSSPDPNVISSATAAGRTSRPSDGSKTITETTGTNDPAAETTGTNDPAAETTGTNDPAAETTEP